MPYVDPDVQRAYQREWRMQRRLRWMAEHGPCARCGSQEDLEVHHRDPFQKLSHRIWTWSASRRDAELAKCEVLCRACHSEQHPKPRLHRYGSYRHGCRCDTCRAANADRRRKQRLRLHADGGIRTRTGVSPEPFESPASTVPPRRPGEATP